MDTPANALKNATIAVFGLGLMGGSFALGLRGQCGRITGLDPNPETCELAGARQIADRVSSDPTEVVAGADLIVLAAPVRDILTLIEQLPRLHPGSPVVLDLGSTKVDICRALEKLPERFDPIGGHPMCGKETPGLANADGNLFREAVFALTPLPRTGGRARSLAGEVVVALGALPLWLDAATHDAWAAHTSHLPYLLAAALTLATSEEVSPLIGPGFLSTTRLAGSSPKMMGDILETNRPPILSALANLRAVLDHLEHLLADGEYSALRTFLAEAQSQRQGFLER